MIMKTKTSNAQPFSAISRRLAFMVSLSLCLSSIFGCAASNTSSKRVKIGVIYSLSGEQASLDQSSLAGAELAAEQINEQGGISGTPVALEVRDAATSGPETLKQAQNLFEQQDISVVVGLSDSDLAEPVAQVSQRYNKIFVTSGATGPVLTSIAPQSTFLACFSDISQAMKAAQYSRVNLGARSAFIIYDQTSTYARTLSDSFSAQFNESRGKISSTFGFTPSAIDTSKLIEDLRRARFDVIFLAALPDEVATIIHALRSAGISAPIVGGDSYDSAPVFALTGEEKHNLYFTTHTLLTPSPQTPEVDNFIALYTSRFGKAPANAFAALGYDAITLTSLAIERAGSTDPTAIRLALETIRNFPGVTGRISYDSNHHIPHKDVTIVTFKDGTPVRAN
jgi:branched-chain amino acid transport system substrate-binding protein